MDYIDGEAAHHSSKRKETRKNRVKFYIFTAFLQDAADAQVVEEHWGYSLGRDWDNTGLLVGCSISLEKGVKSSIKSASKKLWASEKENMMVHQGYHLQGFFEFREALRITEIKSTEIEFGYQTKFTMFRKSWWMGVKNTPADRARAYEYTTDKKDDGTHVKWLYCTPDFKYEYAGKDSKSRAYLNVRDKLVRGASDADMANSQDNSELRIASSAPVRNFFRLGGAAPPAVCFAKQRILLYSAGRTGKTFLALRLGIQLAGGLEQLPGLDVLQSGLPASVYLVTAGAEELKGFTGFNPKQHKVAIWDDLKGKYSKVGRADIFNILDKTTFNIRVLYGMVTFYCEYVIATTQIHPKDWYDWTADEYERSFVGRWDKLITMGENYSYTTTEGYDNIKAKLKQMETMIQGQQLEVIQHQHNM